MLTDSVGQECKKDTRRGGGGHSVWAQLGRFRGRRYLDDYDLESPEVLLTHMLEADAGCTLGP